MLTAEAQAVGVRPVISSPGRRVDGLSPRREARLVGAAQRGDPAAVEALFAAFWPECHRAAWLITRDAAAAEDIAQEAFLAAVAALDRFDRSRRLGPWLHTIVAHRAIDYARARTVRREVHDTALEPAAAEAASPPSERLLACLGGLDHDRRVVVVLRCLLDLSPREIAGVVGVPVGTVNSRMRRGLDQLRAAMEADDG
ncbi:MAG TPA: RNA polymerase sigma factor [Solirubrobacteraceae bacterium]|nr:RNA polymerase sigma factor [Solirubrobacteraceae bacterium]